METMYKGFNRDLKCRGMQYKVGETYDEPAAVLCEAGFHACESPFDVFAYYPPALLSRYARVGLGGLARSNYGDDTKRCGRHIEIQEELNLIDYVKMGVKALLEKAKGNHDLDLEFGHIALKTSDQSAVTNTGTESIAVVTGERSSAVNNGVSGVAFNAGIGGVAASSGFDSMSVNTRTTGVAYNGYCDGSLAVNSGARGVAVSIGESNVTVSTGKFSMCDNVGREGVSINCGNCGAASVSEAESISIAVGPWSRAKGSKGCYIVLAEWDCSVYPETILCVKAHEVDGDVIKSDTWYKLVGGEFVEDE